MAPFTRDLGNLWRDERRRIVWVSALCGVGGALAVYFVTPWGPAVGSDSVMYLLSARNLVERGLFGILWGPGSFEPLAQYPPALSLIIAGLYALGLPVLTAMRWIDVVSFGLLLFFTGTLSYRATGKPGLSIQLCLLFLCTPFLFSSYTDAMTEGLFYLFMITALLTLLLYLHRPGRPALIVSALLALGAFMTRYIGLAISLTCLVGILALGPQGWKSRGREALIFGLLSPGLSILWFLWNFLTTSHLGHRILNSAVDLRQAGIDFRVGLSTVLWNWLVLNSNLAVSYGVRKAGLGLFLSGVGALAAFLFYKTFRRSPKAQYLPLVRWVLLFGLTAVVYGGVYFLAFALTVPAPDLIERIAAPLFIAVLMAILGMIFLAVELWKDRKWLRGLSWVFLIALLSFYLPQTIAFAGSMRAQGRGYTSKAWRESPVISAVRQLPAGLPIVTNEPAAVLFLTGRGAIWVSSALGRQAGPPERYGTSPTDLGETVFRNGGALVLFPSFYQQQRDAYYGKLADGRLDVMLGGLVQVRSFGPYAGIYFYTRDLVP